MLHFIIFLICNFILLKSIFGPNRKPFIYQEVIDRGTEPIKYTEYTSLGRVTEFQYGAKLSEVVMKKNNQKMAYLKNFGPGSGTGWGFMPDEDSLAFIDNHYNQRGYGGGSPVLTFHESRLYKIANAFMMAWPYAFIQIMSSYRFEKNQVDQRDQGEIYIF
jgi:alpha-amylase